jgi:hypothetical protein
MNVVMTESGRFIEVQGTAERDAFTDEELQAMLASAQGGLRQLFELQRGRWAAALKPLVVATRNAHKLIEIRAVLADLGFDITSAADYPHAPEVEETCRRWRATPKEGRVGSPPPPGCRRWPTTPAWKWMRWAVRRE